MTTRSALPGCSRSRAPSRRGPRPDRTIVFAVWTAEERGLLGSEAYALNPLFPREQGCRQHHARHPQHRRPSRDVMLVGQGQNSLEDELDARRDGQGRTVTPEALPERGLFYRADHFPMAKRGVPTLLLMAIGGGADLVEGGREAGTAWVDGYMKCYHQTCDEWQPRTWISAAPRRMWPWLIRSVEASAAPASGRSWNEWLGVPRCPRGQPQEHGEAGQELMVELLGVDRFNIVPHAVALLIAYVLALPIGWNLIRPSAPPVFAPFRWSRSPAAALSRWRKAWQATRPKQCADHRRHNRRHGIHRRRRNPEARCIRSWHGDGREPLGDRSDRRFCGARRRRRRGNARPRDLCHAVVSLAASNYPIAARNTRA